MSVRLLKPASRIVSKLGRDFVHLEMGLHTSVSARMILRRQWISDRSCRCCMEIVRAKRNNLPLSVVDIQIYIRQGNNMN
jgi:hypothetical protein